MKKTLGMVAAAIVLAASVPALAYTGTYVPGNGSTAPRTILARPMTA